jgi:hypothetical protein
VKSISSRITVVEYPKSGGTWLVSMLGDYFDMPKRDIYVADGYSAFDVAKHPWYQNAASLNMTDICVIKSHELPDSDLHNYPTQYIHLVRDGRDVVVSKYFFERDFCVQNGISASFDLPWEEYVRKTAKEWSDFVLTWMGHEKGKNWFRYEDLLAHPLETLGKIAKLFQNETDHQKLALTVQNNTKEKTHKSLDKAFSYNTFVRKAQSGDWFHHFSEKDLLAFDLMAGKAMNALGYTDINL